MAINCSIQAIGLISHIGAKHWRLHGAPLAPYGMSGASELRVLRLHHMARLEINHFKIEIGGIAFSVNRAHFARPTFRRVSAQSPAVALLRRAAGPWPRLAHQPPAAIEPPQPCSSRRPAPRYRALK